MKEKMVVAHIDPFDKRLYQCVGLIKKNHADNWYHGLVKESDLD